MNLAVDKGFSADIRWHIRQDGSTIFGQGCMTVRRDLPEGFPRSIRNRLPKDFETLPTSVQLKSREVFFFFTVRATT